MREAEGRKQSNMMGWCWQWEAKRKQCIFVLKMRDRREPLARINPFSLSRNSSHSSFLYTLLAPPRPSRLPPVAEACRDNVAGLESPLEDVAGLGGLGDSEGFGVLRLSFNPLTMVCATVVDHTGSCL